MWSLPVVLLFTRSVHSAPVDHVNPTQPCGHLHCFINNVTVDSVQTTNIHSFDIDDKCIYTELAETMTDTSQRAFSLTTMTSNGSKWLDQLCNQVYFSIDEVEMRGTVSEDACLFHIEHAECARIKLHTASKLFHGTDQGDSAGGCIFRDSDSPSEGSASYVDDNKQCDETETIVDYYLYNVLGSYEYIVDYGEETVVDSL